MDLQGVDAIVLSIPGLLIVEQGDREELIVDASRSVLKRLEVEIRGTTLHIGFSGWGLGRAAQQARFTARLSSVTSLATTGSGHIQAESVQADAVALRSTSSGDIRIERLDVRVLDVNLSSSGSCTMRGGEVQELRAAVSSSGSYNGGEVRTGMADIRLSGAGDATVWTDGEIRAHLSSSGNLEVYGRPEVAEARTTSSGEIRSLGDKENFVLRGEDYA